LRTVLVTGAGGFAGSHLVEQLLDEGNRVVALVSKKGILTNLDGLLSRIIAEPADLLDGAMLRKVLETHQPSRIYHLAAVSTKFETAGEFWNPFDSIAKGTLNLLHAWRESRVTARMLYVSSAEVYGPSPGDLMPVSETHAFAPRSLYASSKIAAEMFCQQFFLSYGLPIVRVRPFQHTGPRQKASFVCSNFAKQFAEITRGTREPRVRAGNLYVRRDFTDVRDVVRAYRMALDIGEPGEVYNVCSGIAVSIRSMLDALCRITSLDVEIHIDAAKVRPDEVEAYWGDRGKITDNVGWNPQFGIETTLRDLKTHWDDVLANECTIAAAH
jgi:GDP-4-dehydro-6-deoxy-D-mannose reductase